MKYTQDEIRYIRETQGHDVANRIEEENYFLPEKEEKEEEEE